MDELDKVTEALQTDELITIGPDDSQPTYKVQKQVLLEASDYFVKALSGDFQEAGERRIRLPGADLETIRLLVFWLCRKELPRFADELDAMDDDRDTRDSLPRFLPLIPLWLLGDKLVMPKLQNAAMKEMLKIINIIHTPLQAIQEGCSAAPAGSKLRKLMIVEARYEYFEDNILDGEDLDMLAQMPGFMADFVDSMDESKNGHPSACHLDVETFMVKQA